MRLRRRGKVVIVLMISMICFASYLVINTDSTNLSNDEQIEVLQEKKVSFIAVGDNIGHERVHIFGDSQAGEIGDDLYDFKPAYQYVEDLVQDADLAFINQESIIGGVDLGVHGYPVFNSPEALADDLVDVGFNMVAGANNHTFDTGVAAVNHASAYWRNFEDVIYTGAYDSLEDFNTIRTITKNGITFSLLAYTYGTNGYTTSNDYNTNLFDKDQISRDVANAKEISDVIIVSAHWGNENTYSTSSFQEEYAQHFADCGVDVVIGTHPHVIQPIEWIEGENGNETLVAYSLGNFLSTMEDLDNQLEGMLSLEFEMIDEEVLITNVSWIPLINHFGNGINAVYPLEDYTSELEADHYVLSDFNFDTIQYFIDKTYEIIGEEYVVYETN